MELATVTAGKLKAVVKSFFLNTGKIHDTRQVLIFGVDFKVQDLTLEFLIVQLKIQTSNDFQKERPDPSFVTPVSQKERPDPSFDPSFFFLKLSVPDDCGKASEYTEVIYRQFPSAIFHNSIPASSKARGGR
ncbi:hypothetical protein [Endozoicomonas sp. ONNA2]|uniref:hypothetical protein n=1 Tax=Endozoicomonas sp. ONNA2 TaxID=2828741 RepID=UPI0021488E40|nr:hypothetical protein [Endozoicomonas sp. ONNA2]